MNRDGPSAGRASLGWAIWWKARTMADAFWAWPRSTKVIFVSFAVMGSVVFLSVALAAESAVTYARDEDLAATATEWVAANPQQAFWMAVAAVGVLQLWRVALALASIAEDVDRMAGKS